MVGEVVFRSARTFHVIQFALARHSRVLLRSFPDAEYGSSIDFHSGADFLSLRPIYKGLEVRRATNEEGLYIRSTYGLNVDTEYIYFLAPGMSDFVAGGVPQWVEGHGLDDLPSIFGTFGGTL